MVEMLEVADILHQATPRSFVSLALLRQRRITFADEPS